MPRAKRSVQARKRHKKVLHQASGYYGARSRVYRVAKQAVIKAMQYAYRDRKVRKRVMRTLWIQRINAACRESGIRYGQFMHALKNMGIGLNRKMLAEMAVHDASTFAQLMDQAKAYLLKEPQVSPVTEEAEAYS